MPDALTGWRILVTRPAGQAETLCRMIEEQGGEAVLLPAIVIAPPDTLPDLETLLNRAPFDQAIFVSRNAVTAAAELLHQDLSSLFRIPVFAIGSATAEALWQAGCMDVTQARDSDSESLLSLPEMQASSVQGKTVLIVRGTGGRELLGETLRDRGAGVQYCEVYQRLCPEYSRETLEQIFQPRPPDITVITSGEGLKNLLGMLSSKGRKLLLTSQLVTIGKRLATSASDAGFEHPPVVATASDAGLMNAIQEIAGARIT